jgi:hypothetical protein
VVDGARIGSTFVFDRDLNGVWVESAKLLGHGGLSGSSVAVHGDVIVMGSPSRAPSGLGSGSAYAFELDPNGAWVETAELLPDLGHSFQGFGRSVATDGELILVGAEGDISGPGTSLHGAAYVFERDESDGWTQTGKFTTTDHGVIDFGWSLAMEGDLVVVGARHFDGPAPASGAAYVFWRESDGSWTQLARLQPDDLGQRDEFGYSVALRGHLAVVGAPFQRLRREDGTVADEVGAAYVFAVGPDLDGDGIMDACLCPGDVDGDFNVNFTDLATVLHNFGQVDDDPDGGGDGDSDPACQTWPTRCAGDLDRDGDVDISDLGILLANWGSVCP